MSDIWIAGAFINALAGLHYMKDEKLNMLQVLCIYAISLFTWPVFMCMSIYEDLGGRFE